MIELQTMVTTFCCLFLALSAEGGSSGSPSASGVARPSVYSLEQIRDGMRDARGRLSNLLVRYVVEHPAPVGGERVWSRHTIAASGSLRFGENSHFTATFPEQMDLNHTKAYYTVQTFDVFYPRQRYFETSRRNAQLHYTIKLRSDFVLESLGWWPPGDQTKLDADESPHYLHLVLDRTDCRISAVQEQVDGHWCHVLERPGRDRIWVDPSIGFAVRRREKYEPRSRQIVARYELSEYRETEKGIWLPWKIRRTLFNSGQDSDSPGEMVATAVVEKVVANHVPDSLFRFTPPPGTLTQDRDTLEMSQTPGGLDFLDEQIELLRTVGAKTGLTAEWAKRNSETGLTAILRSPVLTVFLVALGVTIVPGRYGEMWARFRRTSV